MGTTSDNGGRRRRLDPATVFLRHLAPGDSNVLIQTFDDRGKNKQLTGTSTFNCNNTALRTLNDDGAGIFFAPNRFNGTDRLASKVTAIRYHTLDFDHEKGTSLDEGLQSLLACGIKPAAVVDSSPGNGHCYIAVEDYPEKKYRAVSVALAMRFGADLAPGVHGAQSVFRLPGYKHQKNKPFDVAVRELNDVPPVSVEYLLSLAGVNTDGLDSYYRDEREPCTLDNDPMGQGLLDAAAAVGPDRRGALRVTCLNAESHTDGKDWAFYLPRKQGSAEHGRFYCHHSHCGHLNARGMLDTWWETLMPGTPKPPIPLPDGIAFVDLGDAPTSGTLKWEWASDLGEADAEIDEIVEGVLARKTISVLYGAPNCGKTYAAIHLAAAIASGTDWLGKRVTSGLVIYLATESPASIRTRMRAYQKHFNVKVPHFMIVSTPISLMDIVQVDDIVKLINEQARLQGAPAKLVIGDTLARMSAGADENSGKDMGPVIQNADFIKEHTGAHVMVIHHCGKDQARGARGWSGLLAAIDTEMEVTEDKGTHCVEVTKQRDIGPKGLRLPFRLSGVEMGVNRWGTTRTSCVVVPTDLPTAPKKPNPTALSREEVLLLNSQLITVFDAVQEFRELLGGIEQINVDDVYEFAKNKFPVPPKIDPRTKKRKTDNRKALVQRAIASLTSNGQNGGKYPFVNFRLVCDGTVLEWDDGF